jgi:large subunit ribosomal protein L30
MAGTLRVTYKKSAIGYSQRQKDTIRSMGFKRLGQTIEVPDSLTFRGMVQHVQHLVTVEVGVERPADDSAAGGAGPTDAGASTASSTGASSTGASSTGAGATTDEERAQ